MTATIPTTAIAAADRARTLADIVTTRAALHPAADALLAIAALLTTAAESLETTEAPVFDGITVTNTTPAPAAFALMEAQALALDNPRAGISDHLTYYVTAPITRRVPELPALNPVSTQLARQEGRLLTRIALVGSDLNSATNPHSRYGALQALVTLHRDFDDLARAVAVDNARPCVRR
ncbi:hypothetical protein [Streptomyces sp. NE06-03C]|uniref:hypothetical protein n=1 Tax=Streptomyces sp. NE06-03C TaxID=3028694 RepID=UPI0029A94F10|nr:hypothetical protein [Streptomyces sp. NE06-03C]MDX2922118.1 hypothetical protein [Streptomyces sp. NE06-03C]